MVSIATDNARAADDMLACAADRLGPEVRVGRPLADTPLLQVEPAPAEGFGGLDRAVDWLREHRDAVEDVLPRFGAVRLRGFGAANAEDFERIIDVFPTLPQGYAGGSTKRGRIGDSARVFESTQAAPDVVLGLHQEMCYLPSYPGKIVFFCQTAPETGGETMVGDMRRYTELVPDRILRDFEDRGIRYLRNFRSQETPLPEDAPQKLAFYHMSWQSQFDTDDPAEAEAKCRAVGLDCRWEDDGSLTSSYDCTGLVTHPRDGRRVSFNVIGGQHHIREALGAAWWDERATRFRRDRKPAPPYYMEYADGGPLDLADCVTLTNLQAEIVRYPRWQEGDVLLIDNIYTAHGRNAFTGRRNVQTALLA